MDTKLKNIKYSMSAKITAAMVVCLCFIGACGSAMFLLDNEEIITTESYFETYRCKEEFYHRVHNVVELKVKLKSEENIKASGETEKSISNNLERLQRIKTRLSDTVNFEYIIKNTGTGESITNTTGEDAASLIKNRSCTAYINQWESTSNFSWYNEEIKQMLSGTPYEVYAAVTEPLKPGDVFYDGFVKYNKVKTIQLYIVILFITCTILTIAAFIYLVCVAGRREKGGEIVLSFVDRAYTDAHTLLVFIAAVMSVGIVNEILHDDNIVALVLAAIVLCIDVTIGLNYILSMIRQIKNRQIIKNSFMFKIYSSLKAFIKLCFNERVFKVWILVLLLIYGMANGVFIFIATKTGLPGLLLVIAFNTAALYFAAKALLSLTQIMNAVKEISTGNLDYPLDNSKMSVAFAGFVEDIQSIQVGLKKAVAEAVKGERMKTDLITNVSHDLKTPLTSIVNYVDLLKKEDLNNEKAGEYVNILEEKSARLKQLIEDLVEASKASSGNIAVKAEKVDLHELVLQACGEYEEKIKGAELDIRINAREKKILVCADGKHMWRIVENLLSNVLKYSMGHSRVYINIEKSGLYGVLTIKNMSAFPLNISPKQLTERFVRGDASRTTEGSGLGLSIAQSLTNIQGGRFNIDIDGDLFKVIVEIPLWLEK